MKTSIVSDGLEQELVEAAEGQGCSAPELLKAALQALKRQRRSIYISAPVNALVEGLYQEDTCIADVKARGDFGIGTFNDLDGEMVLIDGEVYQLKADGTVAKVGDDVKTPFACVCFFKPDADEELHQPQTYEELNRVLEQCIPSKNMLYACRIEGRFKSVRTRSVPRQENYRPLVEVTRQQVESVQQDLDGTLIGFYCPPFISSVNVPGWHFHFISEDRRSGGHLLECELDHGRIELQHHSLMQLGLPVTLDYLTADFNRDTAKDLDEAER
jgi:acetolactate decarboxylase